MEMNNRHLKPKPGGYFTLKSPLGKSIGGTGLHSSHKHKHPKEDSLKENSGITEDGHSGGTNSCYSGTANSVGYSSTTTHIGQQQHQQQQQQQHQSQQQSNGTERV